MTDRYFRTDCTGQELLFTADFSADELARRREHIAEQIGEGAHLLIASAPPIPNDFSIQDANFYYFTGLETAHSYLLVDGGSGRAQLFLPTRDVMDGEKHNRLGFEDAKLISERLGISEVASTDQLTAALQRAKTIYFPFAEVEGGGATRFAANGIARRRAEEAWDGAEPRVDRMKRLLKERFPGIDIQDACPFINDMRRIKSGAEIKVLRQAGALAAAAVTEGMKSVRPGMNENHLQAIAEYVFRDRGHCGLGYGVIAAGGKRTWDGHYHFNNATLQEDEIVLMDCGPNFRHYSSDIARLWPVNGTFSPWHRRVYGFITEYHKALIRAVRPGRMHRQVYDEADAQMARLCTEPGSEYHDMKQIFAQMIEKGIHYLNHGVGMSVHDAVGAWRKMPLEEGMVCVLDPMVWCEPQHEYIRVEDTIVVTADGCERLTGDAPFEVAEIEAILQR